MASLAVVLETSVVGRQGPTRDPGVPLQRDVREQERQSYEGPNESQQEWPVATPRVDVGLGIPPSTQFPIELFILNQGKPGYLIVKDREHVKGQQHR